jgi:hypothetical protein
MTQEPAFDPAQFKASAREPWDRTGKGWNAQTPYIRAWLAESTAAIPEAASEEGRDVIPPPDSKTHPSDSFSSRCPGRSQRGDPPTSA